jgi:Fur family ferric uptake transcriptional regulator
MAEALKSLFIKYLKSEKLPFTPQRERVLDEVLRVDGHFGAEELCQRLGVGQDRVSRATVYRALELLVASGVVQKMRFGEDYYRFERTPVDRHHDHLVCGSCGRVIEFFNEKIEELQNDICKEVSFSPAGHSLVIFGLCKSCLTSGSHEQSSENETRM